MIKLTKAKKWQAAFAYVSSLAYSGAHGTDGLIEEDCLSEVYATKKEAAELVDVGLWRPAPGGWDINGWDEFQVSDEASRRRRERAQKGGIAKAAKAAEKALRSV
jgi:uncharacterized cupin superfamily protein